MPSFDLAPADIGNPDARPRRQKARFDGDLYTPQWVRYSGQTKEGFCQHCKPGKWLQLKNSAYWYHVQFYHGISATSGHYYRAPLQMSTFENGIKGVCHQCREVVAVCHAKKKDMALWFRHAHKCHVHHKPKSLKKR
ncbi:hypothetical protein K493DRAFT_278643 [Basidiobolus meristosporus CBS 931.73]|uniref:Transcription regulator Rua1 C-terminal domain-containing protein n=1 Tax=Basidiobolus meristosporus CBS 931.73 TaxID=1314790 RepID=A0A1Y1YRQ0_9FUNG|nr:hypothetical protein K493DRAFT_278643 [Basidiobolus meristosporus CBS 931.73]|eukprot:ORY00639.1 hypothetical protein K493DRAFT_278643 [Basidiobolus meristosporus CBS 931.73]